MSVQCGPDEAKDLKPYWLRRWSLLVRLRDGYICYVCSNECKGRDQAHHVYAKSLHPKRAYDLDNGVCVCAGCHQPIVHSTWTSWKKFTNFFRRYLRYIRNRKFNEKHQHLVCRHNPKRNDP